MIDCDVCGFSLRRYDLYNSFNSSETIISMLFLSSGIRCSGGTAFLHHAVNQAGNGREARVEEAQERSHEHESEVVTVGEVDVFHHAEEDGETELQHGHKE